MHNYTTVTRNASVLLLALLAFGGLTSVQAQTLDTVTFGDSKSESDHSLSTTFSSTISGGLGQSARQLLPKSPQDVYGGDLTFAMTVDPVKQNFFTIKMWGSDTNASVFFILNCNGKEIGARHGGNTLGDDELYFAGVNWYANRFIYRTCPLPISMTHGKTSVSITIRSSGTEYDYAPIFTYVPQYQHLMSSPSPGIYRAYTHAGSVVDVSSEAQGTAPTVPTPRTLESDTTGIANIESSVNSALATKLNAVGSTLSQSDAYFLAECYDAQTNYGASWITYPTGKSSTDAGNQMVAALDALVTSYASNSSVATGNWGGALGQGGMGDAIRLAWPLVSGSMSGTVAYGGTLGTVTRQAGWSSALRASVDSGRYNRRTIANQDLTCSANIYYANRALELLDPSNALNEAEAIRYYKEACGIQPWIGNDLATGGTDGTGGGPIPTRSTNPPYGPNWYMCTTKGTTKDGDGFVGSDYGEQGTFIYRVGLVSGDAQIQARGLNMTRARDQFRYPGVDDKGYLIMMGTDPIGVRNNDLPSHYAYLGRGYDDDFLMASQGASAIGNDLLGYFQESINDGQAVRNFNNNNPYMPGEWAAVKAAPQTNVQLPQAIGGADFAWVDEENMVVSAKHGEERFFANLYWRQPGFINGLAKVFDLTPTTAHLADVVIDDLHFRSTGQSVLVGGNIDGFATQEDNPVGANDGWPQLVAMRSDLSAIPPTNRDGGRGTGYTFRYGNWLVGINADYSATYTLQLPSDFASSKDFVSGQMMSGPIILAPKTSVVFYLPAVTSPSVPPSRTLYVGAVSDNGRVAVTWNYAGGASSYSVGRSTTSGGPYTSIATGITTNYYIDPSVAPGTAYYYVVTSVSSTGTSGYSPEGSVTPAAPQTAGLPAPWGDIDFGTSTGGSASISGSTYTVSGGPGDIYGNADGCHFLYQVLLGDGIVTARVNSSSSGNNYAKAGLMMRDSLVANAPSAAVNFEARRGVVEFDARGSYGGGTGNSVAGSGLPTPYWVRLARSGSTITGSMSPDGVNWTVVGTTTNTNLSYEAYVGFDVAPASGSGVNTATFSNATFPAGATAAPAQPTSLIVSGGVASTWLTWPSVSGAASYTILRSPSAGGPFTAIATGVVTSTYTDFGLTQGTTYYYEVSAVNNIGASVNSPVASAAPGLPPSPLTNLTATASSGQAVLNWTAVPGATSYTVHRATQLWSTKPVIASGVTTTTYTNTGLTNGTAYIYYVAAVVNGIEGPTARVDVTPPGVPSPWQTQDIGCDLATTISGASSADGLTYSLMGDGTGIGGGSDQFRFVYRPVPGDCDFVARVASETTVANGASASAAAGVMIRNSLDRNSSYAMAAVTPGNGVIFNRRNGTGAGGGNTASTGGLTAPYWVRIKRLGSNVTAYSSADGTTWAPIGGTQTLALNGTCYVGLAVTSSSNVASINAAFDNLKLAAMTNQATGGTATASAGTSGQQAAQAFDGNVSTKWFNGVNGGTGWLQYQFAAGTTQAVSQYVIASASDVPQRDPAAWQFQGSNDGTNWTTLDTQTGQVFANRTQYIGYPILNTTAYAYYRLNITANAGGSGYGLQLSELGLYTPNTAQPSPAATALAASAGNGTVALSWQPVSGSTSYNILRSTSLGGTYSIIGNVTSTSYADSTAANGTLYYYQVTSVTSGGLSPVSTLATATPLAPAVAPSGLTATPANGVISLSWTPSANAATYNVKRATTSGGPYTTVRTISGNYCLDTAPNGTTYYYVISAVDIGGESGNSGEASATPLAPPAAPATLNSVPGNATVGLTWTASATAASYNIKRSTTSGGPFATLTNTTTLGYTDNAVTNGTNFYYVVSAVNIGGEGLNSAESSAKPLPPLPAAPTGLAAAPITGQVSLSWSASTYATSYSVGRSTTSGGPYTVIATPTGTSFVDNTVGSGATYYYVVSGVDMTGTGAASPEVAATIVPAAVTGLSALANSDQVTLLWSAVSGATGYNIGRSTTNGGPYTTVASNVVALSYIDTGLTNGTTYYYVISAVNAGGNGVVSGQVSGTPTAQNLYWDTTTAAGLANGSGNWDLNATLTWSNSSTGTSNPLLPYLNDDSAYFQTGGALTATIAAGTTVKVGLISQTVTNTATTITGGTLQIDSNGGITNAIGSGNKALTISSSLLLNSPNITDDNETAGGSLYLNGTIAETGGSRALTKIGAGPMQLGGANTFSGGVTIGSASQIAFYNSSAFGTGPITFNGGTSLTSTAQIYTSSGGGVGSLANNIAVTPGSFGAYTGDHSMTLSGSLLATTGGSGAFYLSTGSHAGNVTLSGDNHAFNGTIAYYDNGATTLLLNSANSASGASIWNLSGGSTKGIAANVTGSNAFALGELTSASGVGRLYNNQTSGTAIWQIGDGTSNTPSYGGIIADGTTGKSAVTKTGTDTQILAGSNTYTGATTVNGGSLLINGSTATGSAVAVNSGGTLGGTGAINGPATITSGGILAPGNSGAGTLTVSGGLNLNAGSILNLGLGTSTNLLAMSAGTYTPPASGTVTLNLAPLSGFTMGTYTLITGATGISVGNFVVGSGPSGCVTQLNASNGTLSVTFTPPAPTGTSAYGYDASVDLYWSPSTNTSSYNIKRSSTSGGPYTVVATGVTNTYFTDTGLTNGTTYYYVVTAASGSVESANSAQVSSQPLAPSGFAAWSSLDIGNVGLAGSAGYSNGTYSVSGAGIGVWGTADGFQFAFQSMTGNGAIIARVVTQGPGKSGVMMRDTLAANAKYADMNIHQGNGAKFECRSSTGGSASNPGRASVSAPYWMKLERAGNVFTGSVSPDGVTWTQVAQATITMSSTIEVGLDETSNSTTSLSTATFDNVAIVPSALWSAQDIGSQNLAGFTSYNNGTLTVNAAGSDIGGTSDQFRYTYRAVSGDCDIIARVTGVANTNLAAKAGVMIRETLNASSTHVLAALTPGNGAIFQSRSSTGGVANSTAAASLKAPYWVRITRVGNVFTAFTSADGSNWTLLGSQTITMPTSVYLGLAATSANPTTEGTATLDSLTTVP